MVYIRGTLYNIQFTNCSITEIETLFIILTPWTRTKLPSVKDPKLKEKVDFILNSSTFDNIRAIFKMFKLLTDLRICNLIQHLFRNLSIFSKISKCNAFFKILIKYKY